MEELISKNELISLLLDKYCFYPAVVKAAIDKATVVPAAPLILGHWTEDGRCSYCGAYRPTDSVKDFITEDEVRHCYYCGARMGI